MLHLILLDIDWPYFGFVCHNDDCINKCKHPILLTPGTAFEVKIIISDYFYIPIHRYTLSLFKMNTAGNGYRATGLF